MIEVISVNNMRKSDKATIDSGIKSKELMYRAAMGVYLNVSWHGDIAIFTGSGNNAGDGYALALILKENGYRVEIVLCSDKFSNDGLYYFNLCKENNIPYLKFENINKNYDIAVDCLLGTGFKGELKPQLNETINYINDNFKEVISVDINSGLNGDSGLSFNACKSTKTISIGYLKSGLFLNKAKDYIKDLVNVDIGIKRIEKPYFLVEEEDVKEALLDRLNDSNKGSYGYVGIMGGSYDYPGALRLANLGQTALYSGCGVSKLIVPDSIYDLIFNNVLEATIAKMPSKDGMMVFNKEAIDKALKGLKALGIGVGWGNGSDYIKILQYIIRSYNIPIVIDADGLNTLAKMDLNILNESNGNIILTPHLKEFSRLTGYTVSDIKENLISYGLEFTRKYNVTLLLKGPATLVFKNDDVYIVSKGAPGMATAGSGDVLTGILVGLLGRYNKDLLKASAYAAYINGLAGELAEEEYSDISMVASDTARMVSRAIKKIKGK